MGSTGVKNVKRSSKKYAVMRVGRCFRKMRVLIDYLTLSSKIHSHVELISDLGLSDYTFAELPGKYGWQNRMYYRGVSVYFGGNRDDVCIELSGTGCRTVEEVSENRYDWYGFLKSFYHNIKDRDVHISRLDIAADDREGLLRYQTLVKHCQENRYICKARWRIWIDGDEQAIYFGSPKSSRRLRIYNKALERGEEGHWLRAELQMRDDNATSFYLNYISMGGNIGECYGGILNDFLRFVCEPVLHSNYSRALITPWWRKFVGTINKCPQLYLDGGDYTMSDVQRFLERQASSSLKLWLSVNDGDISDIVDMIDGARLNKRQLDLLRKIKNSEVIDNFAK